jgi:hypothetical protein
VVPHPAVEGGAARDGGPAGPHAAAEVRWPAAKERSPAAELKQTRSDKQQGMEELSLSGSGGSQTLADVK